MSGRPDLEIVTELYARLARPYEVVGTLSALVGEPPAVVTRAVGLVMATSDEARVLLESMPTVVRSLATSLQTHNERCIGELRGPVLWSETISARASSFGDRDLFICSTPSRAYDIDENRLLVSALRAVRDAGKAATDRSAGPLDDPRQRAARKVASSAAHWMDHPSLAPISQVRPGPRAVRRTRAGKHRATYQPALDVLERAGEPVTAADALSWCRPVVRSRHRLLLGLVERLEAGGARRVPRFRAERGALLGGPVVFHAGRADRDGPAGVLLGGLLIDVPADPGMDRVEAEEDLAERAGGRPFHLVLDERGIDAALVHAVELAGA